MASVRRSTVDLATAIMGIDSASESWQILDSVDFWGQPVRFDETADEEASRLLLPINWLCDLLERMDHAPSETNQHRAVCQELMDRLLGCCRSPELRESLIDAGVWIAARQYRTAATNLRAVAV